MSNPTNTTTPGITTPGLSLLVLLDLVTALQPEWSEHAACDMGYIQRDVLAPQNYNPGEVIDKGVAFLT